MIPQRVWERLRPPILVLHPSMSSLAFVNLLLPLLPTSAPLSVESVFRVEELPERARRVVMGTTSHRGQPAFDYVLEHDADVLEEHPLSDMGLHVPTVKDMAAFL